MAEQTDRLWGGVVIGPCPECAVAGGQFVDMRTVPEHIQQAHPGVEALCNHCGYTPDEVQRRLEILPMNAWGRGVSSDGQVSR